MLSRRSPLVRAFTLTLATAALAACSGDDAKATQSNSSSGTKSESSSSTTTTTSAAASATISNSWVETSLDPTRLPLGDDLSSTTEPGKGTLYGCQAGNPNAPGASQDGDWIDNESGTWDMTAKLAVEGANEWPTAQYEERVEGDTRTITTNGLPVATVTGTFPIASSDPAYEIDHNPGNIGENDITYRLPANPVAAAQPSCLDFAAVGVLKNGVAMYNGVDARGDDAVAHEVQDVCGGHPAMTTYHYHSIPPCLIEQATGPSTVVGYALDGFPIVVERDAAGNLPTNDDLDQCHGRTAPILVDGAVVNTYHYSATLEFPYSIGCYTGTPTP